MATGIVAGTYNEANARDNFTVVAGSSLRIGFDWDNPVGSMIDVNGGTVKIAIDGTDTTISLDLTTEDGKTIIGEWKGTPENF